MSGGGLALCTISAQLLRNVDERTLLWLVVGVSEPLKSELVLGFVLVTLCWTLSVFPPNPHLRYKANPASSPSLHFRCQTETVIR